MKMLLTHSKSVLKQKNVTLSLYIKCKYNPKDETGS